jgi:hypothetical protein
MESVFGISPVSVSSPQTIDLSENSTLSQLNEKNTTTPQGGTARRQEKIAALASNVVENGWKFVHSDINLKNPIEPAELKRSFKNKEMVETFCAIFNEDFWKLLKVHNLILN